MKEVAIKGFKYSTLLNSKLDIKKIWINLKNLNIAKERFKRWQRCAVLHKNVWKDVTKYLMKISKFKEPIAILALMAIEFLFS